MPTAQNPGTPAGPQNTWMPILLAFAVLVLSTVVVVAASLYFRDDPPAGAVPAATATASATPSATRAG